MVFGPSSPNHPDALTYLRAAHAFRARDLDVVTATIHESVVWHFPGSSWFARSIRGRDALFAFLKELVARTNNTFILEDRHISGNDHHVVAVQRFGATFAGETRMFEVVSVMRFEDGRQRERWFYLPAQEEFDRFFGCFDATQA